MRLQEERKSADRRVGLGRKRWEVVLRVVDRIGWRCYLVYRRVEGAGSCRPGLDRQRGWCRCPCSWLYNGGISVGSEEKGDGGLQ